MVKIKRVLVAELDSVEQLIADFIRYWGDNWPDAERYSQSEIDMISAHLYLSTAKRYLKTDGTELHFTKKELKQAIRHAVEVRQRAGYRDRDNRTREAVCLHYVVSFFNCWESRDDYSDEELIMMRTHLYSTAMERYCNSGFSVLHVTKREIQGTVEMAMSIRRRRERDARLDKRDHEIRQMRIEMGVLADTRVVLGE